MQSPLVTMGGDNLIPDTSMDINFRLGGPNNEDEQKVASSLATQAAAGTFEKTSFEQLLR